MNCVDRVVVLDRGQGLMTGHPDEVRRDERVIAAYLGT
jgi:branched-chain amino acid transport system permease protein